MREYYAVLKQSALFRDIESESLAGALECVGATLKTYEKNGTVCNFGDKLDKIAIVVRGQCHIVRTDINGNRIILLEIVAGKTFGEAISFSNMQFSPINVVASTPCTIIFIPITKVLENMSSIYEYNQKLIKNLIKLMAQKSMALHIKTDILSQKTTRGKLMSYFEYESEAAKSKVFEIPLKREELADYLSVNRSAMIRELVKMKEEGIIDYDKNTFKIIGSK